MQTIMMSFTIFLIFVLCMAIGYIVKGKLVQGSCGGLDTLGIEKECNCEEPCARRKAELEKRLKSSST